jgi:hypothetical protein
VAFSDFGKQLRLGVSQPLYSLDTRWGWGTSAVYQEVEEDYFEDGDEVGRVGFDQHAASAWIDRAFGDRVLRFTASPRVGYERKIFEGELVDPEPGFFVEVPPDRTVGWGGVRVGFDWVPMYLKRTGVDAIDFVEDIPLGLSGSVFSAASYWHVKRANGLRVPLNGDIRAAALVSESNLVTASVAGGARLFEGRAEAWELSAFFHHYFFGLPWQTIAWSVAFDAGREDLDLPLQLTLGEDNGLRGYDVRRFEGDRQFRFNIEDRIFTPLEFLSLRFGGVVFFDAGYAWEGSDVSIRDLRTTAGFGLRIGSARLFRGGMIRVDFAFPLGKGGAGAGVSFSLSGGQIFSVFDNESEFDSKF